MSENGSLIQQALFDVNWNHCRLSRANEKEDVLLCLDLRDRTDCVRATPASPSDFRLIWLLSTESEAGLVPTLTVETEQDIQVAEKSQESN